MLVSASVDSAFLSRVYEFLTSGRGQATGRYMSIIGSRWIWKSDMESITSVTNPFTKDRPQDS